MMCKTEAGLYKTQHYVIFMHCLFFRLYKLRYCICDKWLRCVFINTAKSNVHL